MYQLLDPSRFVVFITGATSGFGAAAARRYVAAGAKVIATGRRQDRLVELQEELGKENCHIIALDVRDRAAVEQAIAGIPAPFDAINIVLANAGLALGLQPAAEASLDDWQTMIDTNVSGLVYTVRLLLPGLIARGGGHVVTLGSVAGEYAYPGGSVYAATKAFVKHFALAIRSDLQGKNVRVTDIEPGLTETEFSLVRFKGDADKAGNVYSGTKAMTAEDIAESIFWATSLPEHVNVNKIQLMATTQAIGAFDIFRG
ncbi:SDR family NAD(P)-dependent oxidoreductase [Devosia sp. 63-57]|uniref:SDR family NAD(P)-dependent oxidoreductase n=1 Tax=Devosia sp. 63-57 TaxID=1895751 RepID=UPI00086F8D35|nr:SDR family NAD(P)-dependent oxidoreductase [Devosia sp. 63-57]ODT50843.1 MAG: NAD(P)-dependent oxidoreductase [Pelagibacterium sp. SCN 63-126]ODU86772.1 MAG: NAD(P)-dependent oxidoreductase [Pelagibacterium sp. SCN 63-17]OJX44495.1 MAG: NAD(P)-dependent oxidoreductase [Devosia sp. 63-57]